MKHYVAAALLAIGSFVPGARLFAQLPAAPDHVVIVFMENKGYSDIIGSPDAPYINSLVAKGASLTNFTAFHHPSQPNYFEFFAGNQLGVCTDECPATPFGNHNLASVALAKGISFTGFAENLPDDLTVCANNATYYARRHCPWTYFSNVPAASSVDFSKFPQSTDPKTGYASLPRISMVIPNLIHDMHSGDSFADEIENGDTWLRQNLGGYITWAMTNNSLLILTWDEDSSGYPPVHCCPGITTPPPDNRIPTLLIGAAVKPGSMSNTPYTHHDLLRTVLDLYGLPLFAGAATGCASDITGIWTTPQGAKTGS